jgi:SAM-dependent methyltransferase
MTDTAGYHYDRRRDLGSAIDVEDAIRMSVLNYMHDQLGLSIELCEERVRIESDRRIPRGVFDELGWDVDGATLLDLGCGQGGALLEALSRGADAYGVEPGEEFAALCGLRLQHTGRDPQRIIRASGYTLPFADEVFDYAISLQVLEHLRGVRTVLRELFRVLKPGAHCYISCENYLAFREPHYRLPWLPMLPKPMGALYLRVLGRDPDFLRRHIHYVTYFQIWRWARHVGFRNSTYDEILNKIEEPDTIRRWTVRAIVRASRRLGPQRRRRIWLGALHAKHFWRVGVRVRLEKPK